jgi:hypothetical protein
VSTRSALRPVFLCESPEAPGLMRVFECSPAASSKDSWAMRHLREPSESDCLQGDGSR